MAAQLCPARADTHPYIARKRPFMQPNASAPAPLADYVGTLGGEVELELPNWMMISIPEEAAQAIREHPAVKYLQKVVSGPFVEPTATATAAHHLKNEMQKTTNSMPPWTSGTYQYDGAGNISAIGSDTYAYDTLSRLVQANVKGNSETYVYDAFGNLISKTTTPPPPAVPLTVSLTTATGTNHLVNQNYDTAGNLTGDGAETNEFDPVNMQREKDIPASHLGELYVYNAADERLATIDCPGPPASCSGGPPMIWSIRDESGKVLRQYEGTFWFGSPPLYAKRWAWKEDYV